MSYKYGQNQEYSLLFLIKKGTLLLPDTRKTFRVNLFSYCISVLCGPCLPVFSSYTAEMIPKEDTEVVWISWLIWNGRKAYFLKTASLRYNSYAIKFILKTVQSSGFQHILSCAAITTINFRTFSSHQKNYRLISITRWSHTTCALCGWFLLLSASFPCIAD